MISSGMDFSFNRGLLQDTMTSQSATANISTTSKFNIHKQSAQKSSLTTNFDFLSLMLSSLSLSKRHNWSLILTQFATSLAHYTLSTPTLSATYHNILYKALSTRFPVNQLQTFAVIQNDLLHSNSFSMIHLAPNSPRVSSHLQQQSINIAQQTKFSILICSHVLWPKHWDHMGLFSSMQYLIQSGTTTATTATTATNGLNLTMDSTIVHDMLNNSTPNQPQQQQQQYNNQHRTSIPNQFNSWIIKPHQQSLSTSTTTTATDPTSPTNQQQQSSSISALFHQISPYLFDEKLICTNSHDQKELNITKANYNASSPNYLQLRAQLQSHSDKNDDFDKNGQKVQDFGSFKFFEYFLKRCHPSLLYSYTIHPPTHSYSDDSNQKKKSGDEMGDENNDDSDDEQSTDQGSFFKNKSIPTVHLPIHVRNKLDEIIDVSQHVYSDRYLTLLEHIGIVHIEVELKRSQLDQLHHNAKCNDENETVTKQFLCSPIAYSVLMCFAENEDSNDNNTHHEQQYNTMNQSTTIMSHFQSPYIQPFNPYTAPNLPPGLNVAQLSVSKYPMLSVNDVADLVHITPIRARIIISYWANQGCLKCLGNDMYTSTDMV